MADIYNQVQTSDMSSSDIVNKQAAKDSLNEKLLRLCSWHKKFVQKCANIRRNNQILGISDRRKFYNYMFHIIQGLS